MSRFEEGATAAQAFLSLHSDCFMLKKMQPLVAEDLLVAAAFKATRHLLQVCPLQQAFNQKLII